MKKIVNVIVLMLATLLMAAGQTALAEEQAISAKEMMRLLDDFVQEIAPEKLDEWLDPGLLEPLIGGDEAMETRVNGLFDACVSAPPDTPQKFAAQSVVMLEREAERENRRKDLERIPR